MTEVRMANVQKPQKYKEDACQQMLQKHRTIISVELHKAGRREEKYHLRENGEVH
jgi:hypothetical protein